MAFICLVTDLGQAKIAAAIGTGGTVNIVECAVGDGGGAPTTPSSSDTSLVNEVGGTRFAVNEITRNLNQVSVNFQVPYTVGGFTIREVACFDDDGDMILIANVPEDEKPGAGETGQKTANYTLTATVQDGDVVQVTVDPLAVNASKAYVGQNFVRRVPDITALRALTGLEDGQAFYVADHTSEGDGGGGVFVVVGDESGETGNDCTTLIIDGKLVERRNYGAVTLSMAGVSSGDSFSDLKSAVEDCGATFLSGIFSSAEPVASIQSGSDVKFNQFSLNGAEFDQLPLGQVVAKWPSDFPVPRPLFATYAGGRVFTDFDASVYDIEQRYGSVKKYYCDPVNGSSGGAGTEADPLDSPYRAAALEASSPSAEDAFVIYAKPYNYDQSMHFTSAPSGLTKPYAIKRWGDHGRVRFLQGRWGDFATWVDETGGVWSSGDVSNAVSVFDESIVNDLGDPTMYDKVDAVVDLVPGSWYQDGGDIYIYTLDGREPDASIGIGRLIVTVLSDGLQSMEVYLEDCDFLGGNKGVQQRITTTAIDFELVTKRCKFMFAQTNGAETYGAKLTAHQDAVSAYNGSDGFNYHSNTSDYSRESLCLEVNCSGYRNGHDWSPSQNMNNGSTAHDRCIVVRYGTLAFENQGPNFADVNDVYSYNFGCTAYNSARTTSGPDNADFDFSAFGGSVGMYAWLDCCYAPHGASDYALTSTATKCAVSRSTIHLSVYGAGTIGGW